MTAAVCGDGQVFKPDIISLTSHCFKSKVSVLHRFCPEFWEQDIVFDWFYTPRNLATSTNLKYLPNFAKNLSR